MCSDHFSQSILISDITTKWRLKQVLSESKWGQGSQIASRRPSRSRHQMTVALQSTGTLPWPANVCNGTFCFTCWFDSDIRDYATSSYLGISGSPGTVKSIRKDGLAGGARTQLWWSPGLLQGCDHFVDAQLAQTACFDKLCPHIFPGQPRVSCVVF